MTKTEKPNTAREVFAAEAEQNFSAEELCGEIVTTLSEMFICAFSKSGNSFCMEFLNGQKFHIQVSQTA